MNNYDVQRANRMLKNITVPTGNIVCVEAQNGQLEYVSVGDYGKDVNLKADFMGLTEQPAPFEHCEMLPLEEKWVITISTQYGCGMKCSFCDVPKVGNGRNVGFGDLCGQILSGLDLHPEVTSTQRLNIHFARMGEPSWNPEVLDCARWLKEEIDPVHKVHPVISTIMPKRNLQIKKFISDWLDIKNNLYQGNAGLQISINSTNEDERSYMFNHNALELYEIADLMKGLDDNLMGRKITLNFAVADYEIDPEVLLEYFDPAKYICKLTPMHKTATAEDNNIKTPGKFTSYHPFEHHEKALRDAGYDVIVFLASEYEDMGRITCGNAILAGTLPEIEHTIQLFD